MKLQLLGFLILSVTITYAQPKVITQAVMSATINVIAPEEEEPQNNQGGGMNFRNMMDGETKATIWVKNDMVKTVLKSDVFFSTIYRNNSSKITTTIMQIMGAKYGFYISDSEQVALRDSMVKARRSKDSTAGSQPRQEPTVELIYPDDKDTKKVAGYECRKAYLVTTRLLGIKDTITVWYNPDIKFANTTSAIGMSGFGNIGGGNMGNVNGIEKLNGFAMYYEIKMPRNRRMEIKVTKIDTDKEIADKEFDLPKDVEIKPMKEMRNLFGRGNMMQRPN